MDLNKSIEVLFNTVMDNLSDKESDGSFEFMNVATSLSHDRTKRQKPASTGSMRTCMANAAHNRELATTDSSGTTSSPRSRSAR
jgi:hypothetical protein